ncbi:ABC transporter permease [Enterococcus sp. DIV0876]|uniref:ABC transporter permease n=1 Tax=Enterococcus sp. DIV0876 TaxID=2774633 RepID=UPI003D2FC677
MNKAYFLFELRQLFRSKKTIGLFCLLIVYAGVYCLQQRDYRPIERVDQAEMTQRYQVRQAFLEEQAAQPSDHWSAALAIAAFTPWNQAEKARLDALAEGDWQAYAEATSQWYQVALQYTDDQNIFYTPEYYTYKNYYAAYDGRFGYASTARLMESYSQLPNTQLSQAVMEQKTGIQTVYRAMLDSLPIVLLSATLFLALDHLLKERKHRTLFLAYPVAPEDILWVKTAAVMFCSTCMTLMTIGLIWIGTGLQYGFGSGSLPVAIFSSAVDARYPITSMEAFTTQSVGLFLIQCIGTIFLIQLIYTRSILLLSVLFRSEYMNLLLMGFCLITPFIFQHRWFSVFLDRTNTIYLYQEVGKILSGYSRFYFGSSSFTLSKGLLWFGVIWLLIEIGLFFKVKSKTFRFV